MIKRQQKRAISLATSLQNEFISDAARLTSHGSNLSYNKWGCCTRKVLAESREVLLKLRQNLYMLRVLPWPNANFATSLHEVTHIPCLARLARNFIQSEVGIHVAKQVARSCCPLYFSFNMIWPGAWVPRFDLTKCAFVVSLLVFKRDCLLKNLVGSSA